MGSQVYEMQFDTWKRLALSGKRYSDGEVKMLSLRSHESHVHEAPLAWISGEDAFELHDTYGMRPDFVADMVRDSKLVIDNFEYQVIVDRHGYDNAMNRQRERARADLEGYGKGHRGRCVRQGGREVQGRLLGLRGYVAIRDRQGHFLAQLSAFPSASSAVAG